MIADLFEEQLLPVKKQAPKAERLNLRNAKLAVRENGDLERAIAKANLPAWAVEAFTKVWTEAYASISWHRIKLPPTEFGKGGTRSTFVGPSTGRKYKWLYGMLKDTMDDQLAVDAELADNVADIREFKKWCRTTGTMKDIWADQVEGELEFPEGVDYVAELQDKARWFIGTCKGLEYCWGAQELAGLLKYNGDSIHYDRKVAGKLRDRADAKIHALIQSKLMRLTGREVALDRLFWGVGERTEWTRYVAKTRDGQQVEITDAAPEHIRRRQKEQKRVMAATEQRTLIEVNGW